ncbi:hypothetical protein ACL02T_08090 [Pseudonocardia sp. RS010]|uniref:hypothetical protein n=1 Tax=Pseudonocardia sp. RS010 TaxID=3385979 RepID=UPI0039A27E40
MSFSAGPLADTLTALGVSAAIAVLVLVAGAPLLVDLVGPRKRRLQVGAAGTLPVTAPVSAPADTAPAEPVAPAAESGGAPARVEDLARIEDLARVEDPAQSGRADARSQQGASQQGVSRQGVSRQGASAKSSQQGLSQQGLTARVSAERKSSGSGSGSGSARSRSSWPGGMPEQTRPPLAVRGAAREISLPLQRTTLAPVIPLQRPGSPFS